MAQRARRQLQAGAETHHSEHQFVDRRQDMVAGIGPRPGGIFTIQEHRLWPMHIEDTKAQAKAAGRSAIFSAARLGGSRGPACGGVAILAKSPFGLKEAKPPKPRPE